MNDAVERVLQQAGIAGAARLPLAGDASTRRYQRLVLGERRAILMECPAAAETEVAPPDAAIEERRRLGYNASARLAGARVEAFVAIAGQLRKLGLSAPIVYAADFDAGLAVLEDLGDDLFARWLERDAGDERALYSIAVDAILRLHAEPPPAMLEADGARWPLARYDTLAFDAGLDPFMEWWPAFTGSPAPDAAAAAEWTALWAPIKALGESQATAFAHRDYHAENLVWLPDRAGPARVGMLDFQDAVLAHPAWDLIHLLQDARRDVSPEVEAAMLDRYLAARPDLDRDAFLNGYYSLAAVNAARILGRVFARQEVLFKRNRYTAFMPRTWRHLERDLARAGLTGLQAWFDRWAPRETRP